MCGKLMQTNLLQNYIAKSTTYQEQQKRPEARAVDHNALYNRTFAKPLPPKGKLLRGTFLPTAFVKNMKYNAKALVDGAKGKANDHQLGKVNDVGLVAGMGALAAYLFTMNRTPMKKGMEILGPAAFLASMAIWPKIAIRLPALFVHGVDPMQKYQDSQGRVKPFFQDPQFIPWDLYSDKIMDKAGDRLGVPKDMPNRRAYTQEKMRKVAVQSNTLWMLTAGPATPLLTAMICNMAEKPLGKFFDKQTNKKADELLETVNFNDTAKALRSTKTVDKVNEIIGSYIDKTKGGYIEEAIDERTVDRFSKLFSEGKLSTILGGKFKEDLMKDMAGKPMDEAAANKLRNIADTMTDFDSKYGVLDQYYKLKLGKVEESVIANQCNRTSEAVLDSLGFTKDDYKDLFTLKTGVIRREKIVDREAVGKKLYDKFETIVKDEEKYKKAMTAITDSLKEVETKYAGNTNYEKYVKDICEQAGKSLREQGLDNAAEEIGAGANSLKSMMIDNARNRVDSLKNHCCRLIQTLDFFKRADDKTKNMPEDIVKMGKEILAKGHIDGQMTKFEGTMKKPFDFMKYQQLMRSIYGVGDVDPKSADVSTIKLLDGASLKETFKRYQKEMILKFGGAEYGPHKQHIYLEQLKEKVPSLKKFLQNGIAVDEYITTAVKNKRNSQIWLKTFGGLGIALMAVAVVAQFFFGKVKKPAASQEVKQ